MWHSHTVHAVLAAQRIPLLTDVLVLQRVLSDLLYGDAVLCNDLVAEQAGHPHLGQQHVVASLGGVANTPVR